MADLFKSLKPTASLAKHGFDLSRKHVFSSKAGQALPCLSVETVPGDHFEIDLMSLTRTETFNTAAFVRGKQRYDFFFVPYSQLWHPFNQFITQRTDKHSTRQRGHVFCPVVSLKDLLEYILTIKNDNTLNDIMGFHAVDGMIRILDLLGYGNFQWLLGDVDPSTGTIHDVIERFSGKYVNIFRLAAYQHIWYDYYRNKYYDVEDTGGISSDAMTNRRDYVSAFNFDDIDCSTFSSSIIDIQFEHDEPSFWRIFNLLSPRYIQWKKDLFTSSLPSQQFGAVSAVDISSKNIILDSPVAVKSEVRVDSDSESIPRNLYVTSTGGYHWNIPSAFDVLTLRKAEALQAWKQATLRAGNMTDDSFKAHFGTEPYYEGDENVHYLGSFSAALQVNAVESTASTSADVPNSKTGDLGATGTILANGQKINFDCKDFGVIMCIASFLPESEYQSNAIDKANTLYEQFDFFTPEFQNIGLEAITFGEQNLTQPHLANQVLGFAPRYHMYKTAVDKVFGEFADSLCLGSGTQQPRMSHSGSLKAWVTPRTDYINSNSQRKIAQLYVSPKVFDSVFGIYANQDQNTDQLIHNVFFDIKAIRPMSKLGLPQF